MDWKADNLQAIQPVSFSTSKFYENKNKKSHSFCKPVIPLKQLPLSCTPHSHFPLKRFQAAAMQLERRNLNAASVGGL